MNSKAEKESVLYLTENQRAEANISISRQTPIAVGGGIEGIVADDRCPVTTMASSQNFPRVVTLGGSSACLAPRTGDQSLEEHHRIHVHADSSKLLEPLDEHVHQPT